MNHLATAFAGRYNDFLFFPTRHNDPLCYVNKTSWLSTDLSAAAAAALRSAPKTMHQRRDSCSKPKQSLTSGKVTHHISFTLSISGDAATFWCLFFSAQRQQALWNLFSAWCQFLKESCSRSATFVITVEKPTLWLCPDKKKKKQEMFQIKTPRTVYGEEPLLFWLHCNASPNVRSLARKIHMSNTQAGNGENVSASFLACLPAYLLTH